MRIGIVSGEFPPMVGGVGACSQILAHRLRALGHELFLFSDARARSAEFPLTGISGGWGPGALRALRRWAQRRRLDVVNLQFQTAAFAMSPWIHFLPRFLAPAPLVTTFHDLRVPRLFRGAGPLRAKMVLRLARSSAAAICTNHEDFARLQGQVPCVRMIPIGSNIPARRPPPDAVAWRRRQGVVAGDTLLAWFGLVNHSKGLETLLQGLAELRAEGLPLRLALIGGEAGDSDRSNVSFLQTLEAQIARLQLEPALLRTGYLPGEEVAIWLSASDLVVLPFRDGASFRRGSLMAAIQHGCAIVTTRPRVPVPEFVHGQSLWLVPPDDAPALCAALRTLLASPDHRHRLRQGTTRLAARFDWDAIAVDYATCLEAASRAGR